MSSGAAELLLQVLLDRLSAAQIAGEGPADPDDVVPDRLVEEHRIESDDALDDRSRKPEALRDEIHDLRADPAVLPLA